MHRSFVRGGVLLATALLAATTLAAPVRAATLPAWSATGDSGGDVTDGLWNVVAEPRADLSYASATYRSDRIYLAASVAEPTDPRVDPGWADGASAVLWAIDTNGDDTAEYVVSLEASDGKLVGFVYPGPDFDEPIACPVFPAYSAKGYSYSVTLAPSCIGSPASFKWGVVMSYDTDPADPDAPVASDIAPDRSTMGAPDHFALAGPIGANQGSGYWMLTTQGTVYGFGDAQNLGNISFSTTVDIEPTASGRGYWMLSPDGRLYGKGDAGPFMTQQLALGEKAVSLSATPTGMGCWIFTDRGRVLPLGDAQFFGDMSGTPLNGSILGSVATPTGQGYWMVASDGGIFSFGDAKFAGSMGDKPLDKPVISMAADPDGHGYWLVASDGGIFAFDAPFYGSMGGTRLTKPISGIVPGTAGYLMVAQDGGIFAFGNVPFHGSLGKAPPANPVIAVALLQ